MLKEVRQKLKLLSSSANTAALMQAATADFRKENAATSDEEIEGGASVGISNQKKRVVRQKLKIAQRGQPKTNNFLD